MFDKIHSFAVVNTRICKQILSDFGYVFVIKQNKEANHISISNFLKNEKKKPLSFESLSGCFVVVGGAGTGEVPSNIKQKLAIYKIQYFLVNVCNKTIFRIFK